MSGCAVRLKRLLRQAAERLLVYDLSKFSDDMHERTLLSDCQDREEGELTKEKYFQPDFST